MDIFSARMSGSSNEDDNLKRAHLNPLKWTTRRELVGRLYGYSKLDVPKVDYSRTRFYKGLHHSFGHANTWNNASGVPYHYGAVFNFDFSPDGSTLVAACERRSLLLFDPLTHRMHQAKTNAHLDCVNVAKFIDSRLFATCSDDRTVRLWDLRNMDKELQTLSGHSNWVKNIECVDGKLLTSGFDGNILLWDHNSYEDTGNVPYQVLFHTRNLMRTALSADKTKLVMSTSSGYIIIVHDLDISKLADDLHGFKPNIYRLMQMNPSTANNSIAFNHLFSRSRTCNRLELITDFTENVDVEIIASLMIHPSGDFMVSRNTSSDEQSEHTCVHDLRDDSIRKAHHTEEGESSSRTVNTTGDNPQYILSLAVDTASGTNLGSTIQNSSGHRRSADHCTREGVRDRSRSRSPLRHEGAERPTAALASDRSDMLSRVLPSAQQRLEGLASTYAPFNGQFMIFIQGGSDGVQHTLVLLPDDARSAVRRPAVSKNSRLIYYVEEPNMRRGYIKEQCFSNDSRVVCSPFAHGVRLLGFDTDCQELEEKMAGGFGKPKELQEIASMYTHQNLVVATKYSPTHNLLVTGCLDGQVCFHQPLL